MVKPNYISFLSVLLLLTLYCQVTIAQQRTGGQVRSPRLTLMKDIGRLPEEGYIARATDLDKFKEVIRKAGLEKFTRDIQPHYKTIQVDLPYPVIDSLFIKTGLIDFIDIKRKPREEGAIPGFDPSANKLNRLFSSYREINGDGLTLSIKEKRFDSTDIDFLNRVKLSTVGSAEVSSHATRMATMAAGAGNSLEISKGAAWGAQLYSASFDNLMPEDPALYSGAAISLQNHSYGTAIENFYGADAAAYDEVSYELPYLLHVFSSGNIGEESPETGPYKDLPWANLSGSFKMSKNSISVGAIDSFSRIESRSSKGPAYDGRIKPELVAFGQDGSSGAAAIVSGIAVALQHRYLLDHGQLPPSSLVKAILLNTATDLLAPGPDFQSGFGNADAYKAMKSMEEGHYLIDSLEDIESKDYSLEVPVDSKNLKLVLCWVDPPSSPNIEKALVNNLDITLIDPLGNSILPWILSSYPKADSLAKPAIKGRDTLNNVEQVSIENPIAGKYTIRVSASVKSGKQPFAITWLYNDSLIFSWSYPSRSDKLIAGRNTLLRWNENLQGTGKLSYRMHPGNWKPLGTVDLSIPYFAFSLPKSSGLIQFSMENGNERIMTDSFAILEETFLKVGYVCRDSFMLYWQNRGADSFRLYRLSEQYLESILQGRDTSYVSTIDHHKYFAVAPIIDGMEGFRSSTRHYEFAGVGCYLESFLVDLMDQHARISIGLSTLKNLESLILEKQIGQQWTQVAGIRPVSLPQYQIKDSNLIQGLNRYRIKIGLSNGSFVYSPVEQVFYFANKELIIYPNPASKNGEVNLAIQDTEDLLITVFDIMGRKWIERKVDDLDVKLSLAGLPAGVYFYRFTKKNKHYAAGRLVIQ